MRDPCNKNLQPNYVSWGYASPDLATNFFMRGTFDQTSWYVVEDCLKFYEVILGGLANVTAYNSRLISEAADLLCKEWKTIKLEMPASLEAPFMKLIKLPMLRSYMKGDTDAETIETSVRLIRDILDKFNVVSCIVCVQSELYCRISCFVYNKMEDYVALKDAVLSLIDSN